jgi:hypothetical protein
MDKTGSNTPIPVENDRESQTSFNNKAENPPLVTTADAGTVCPNCGAELLARKCKLFCTRPGCGYLVTCSEW